MRQSQFLFILTAFIFNAALSGCSGSSTDSAPRAPEIVLANPPKPKPKPVATFNCDASKDSIFSWEDRLYRAIETGQATCVSSLLNSGNLDPNTKIKSFQNENFPLNLALTVESLEAAKNNGDSLAVVKVLVASKVSLATLGAKARTPLMLTLADAQVPTVFPEVVRFLIEQTRGTKAENIFDREGLNAFHLALSLENSQFAKDMVAAGYDYSSPTKNGQHSAFVKAQLASWSEDDLLYLLSLGLDYKDSTYQNTNPLVRAVINNQNKLVDKLVGLDPSLVNTIGQGVTPLTMAVYNQNYKMTLKLLDLGADPDLTGTAGSDRPLHLALQGKNRDLIDILIRKVQQKDATDFDGNSFVALAAKFKWIEPLEQMILLNFPLDIQNKKGLTPLFITIDSNELTLARLLLQGGAKTELVDNKDFSPLMAVKTVEAAQLLLDFNADLTASSSILYYAIKNNNFSLAEFFLTKNVKGDATDLALALVKNNLIISELILKQNVNPGTQVNGYPAFFSIQSVEAVNLLEKYKNKGSTKFDWDEMGGIAETFIKILLSEIQMGGTSGRPADQLIVTLLQADASPFSGGIEQYIVSVIKMVGLDGNGKNVYFFESVFVELLNRVSSIAFWIKDLEGNTLLHLADSLEELQLLLALEKMDLEALNNAKETPLVFAQRRLQNAQDRQIDLQENLDNANAKLKNAKNQLSPLETIAILEQKVRDLESEVASGQDDVLRLKNIQQLLKEASEK